MSERIITADEVRSIADPRLRVLRDRISGRGLAVLDAGHGARQAAIAAIGRWRSVQGESHFDERGSVIGEAFNRFIAESISRLHASIESDVAAITSDPAADLHVEFHRTFPPEVVVRHLPSGASASATGERSDLELMAQAFARLRRELVERPSGTVPLPEDGR